MTLTPPRSLYLLVIMLHLVSDTALSPFFPQLFERLFGLTDPSATGTFIWVCRVAALASMPLWGLASRYLPPATIVTWGLAASAVLEVALALAPGYASFTALAAAQVVATMSLTLAYPAFVGSGSARDRVRDVTTFAYVTNAGVILATLLGAGIVALPNPRWGIAASSVLYLVLLGFCRRDLPRSRGHAQRGATADGADAGRPDPRRALIAAVAVVCAIVLVAETGRLVVRPFFTSYAESGGLGTAMAAGLFLLPQAVALAVLPLAPRAHNLLGRALLPCACAAIAAGLAVQFLGPDPLVLAAGRVLFGCGLGFGQVALDLAMFRATGTGGPAFSAVATTRTAATLISPLLATGLAASGLGLPLLAGALLYGALALLLLIPVIFPAAPASAAAADDTKTTGEYGHAR